MTKGKILLTRLQPKFEKFIRQYVEDHKRDGMTLGRLADDVGIHLSHLSNLINKNDKGEYRRPLSVNYVDPFIERGILDMSKFYDNAPDSQREAKWAEAASLYQTKEGKKLLIEVAEALQEDAATIEGVISYIQGRRAAKKESGNIVKPLSKDTD